MRTLLTALFLLSIVAVHAEPSASAACIIESSSYLPRVPGLVIKSTGTRPAAPIQGASSTTLVDVDFVAAGQAARWTFLCALTPNGAIVQRVAN